MKKLVEFVLISGLLAGMSGCASNNSEKAAEEARVAAADARVAVADANARVKAADAHVRAADARVKAADADVRAADAGVDAAAADRRVKATEKNAPTYPVKPARSRLVIPSGTQLTVILIDALSSDNSAAGDRFMATLADPVVINGTTILQKGTKVQGRVIEAEGAGRVKGRASISLALTDIVQGTRSIPITTETFAATGESSTTRDAATIAGGAGIGAIIGAVTGGKKGAGVGAAAGGAGGTGVVLATKGKEIRYGSETRLSFTLSSSVEM